ncbi:hypothetical protein G7068_12035 [Leucobacter viscericola]|uniref:Uncharacterized protein n=1 Tax=Leucobacter viscericola TaxID=2714935 RepID=A0A6G7XHB5_9MICO|nr:hypothetical protein [Leucobacter viscericola]QIK63839.1 hypothetical protein G7068_12035 [Leucobacter viscericola]
MVRRIPGKLLPHRNLVQVIPYLGGGANGRSYGEPVAVKRAQINDEMKIKPDQYDAETTAPSTVFFERSEVPTIPAPESRVILWAGTVDERETHVESVKRHEHPRIGDLLEVKLS